MSHDTSNKSKRTVTPGERPRDGVVSRAGSAALRPEF